MATPVYNTWGAGHRPWGRARGQVLSWISGVGSWFGGGTPQYLGAGQPAPDDSVMGSGTPLYLLGQMGGPQPDDASPAPNPMAIVVPRP